MDIISGRVTRQWVLLLVLMGIIICVNRLCKLDKRDVRLGIGMNGGHILNIIEIGKYGFNCEIERKNASGKDPQELEAKFKQRSRDSNVRYTE